MMESELLTQHPELKRLARRIRRSKGEFSLFFVECNLPTFRYELANALSAELEMPAVQVTLPSLSEHLIQFDQLIAEHIKDEPLDSSVFLFGLENWLPTLSKETLHQTVQQLNWRRSSFARLKRPLVIWLPKYALDLLAEHTPDFFDWYSGVFVFKSEKYTQDLEIEATLEQLHRNSKQGIAGNYLTQEETRRWLHTLNSLMNESNKTDESYVRLLNEIALLYKKLGDLDKAQDYIQKSLDIVQLSNKKLQEANVLNNLAGIYSIRGQDDKALELFEQSLRLYQVTGYKQGEGAALNNISQIYQKKGEFDTTIKYLNMALVLAKEFDNKANESSILDNISGVYQKAGKYKLALEYVEKALKIDMEMGNRSGEGIALNNISQIYNAMGEYDEAYKYLEQSLELSRETGNRSEEGVALNNMATIAFAKGDSETSMDLHKKSLVIKQEVGDKSAESMILSNIAQIFNARGDYEAALEYLEESLAIKLKIGDFFNEPSSYLFLGDVNWSMGDEDKALSYWLKAYGAATKVGNQRVLDTLQIVTAKLNSDKRGEWEAQVKNTT